ncbi:hypothetical protein Slin15195_G114630 [Septoria linicola]|uniref:Hydrophobin n=1 Tax=Septoria linicola TaxID=215465 RepID=A0A9Q9AZB1_9PEZI|nr:hypothetical protein Slin14017_G122610 [Septoria linicola]USW58144.1 hypothetical protein Slin15195_G114630 [Septoria linicola]
MFRLFALLSLAASYAMADPENLCRVTNNYGCTVQGVNCNDEFTDDGRVPTFAPAVASFCPGAGRTKSEDSRVCCTTNNLNGGYCPNFDELEGYGFIIRGFGANQDIQPKLGPAVVKCNQRGGPHYCTRMIRVGGTVTCTDQGLY